jgi:hypothetical protein
MSTPLNSYKHMNYRQFQEHVLEAVEWMGSQFTEPDDDWTGMCLVYAKDGITMIPLMFRNFEEKQMLWQALPQLVKSLKGKMVAMVASTWTVWLKHPLGDDASEEEIKAWYKEAMEEMSFEKGYAENHAERVEKLVVSIIDRERHETYMGEIIRTNDKPPMLTAWDGPSLDSCGAAVDGIIQVLR